MTEGPPPFPHPPDKPGLGEKLALATGALWLVIGGGLLWIAPETIGFAGLLIPLFLLIAAYVQARQLRRARSEASQLRNTLSDMQSASQKARQSPPQALKPENNATSETAPEPMPLFRSHQSREIETTKPSFTTRRDPATAQFATTKAPQAQLSLGLDQSEAPVLAATDFLLALNFPQTPQDTDGFRALRLALRHPPTVPLIQASQDVLTLMSQIGLYMDDLRPDHARPELWRRFFEEGERGGAVGALGGIRDTDALLTCANQMRDDPVFRDATHHFLRRFDQVLATRIQELDDADLIRLADTRSARAFMLLGRAAGIFE